MRKAAAALAILALSLIIFLPFSFAVKPAFAQDAGYSIQNVNHTVQVLYSGHIVINDTIEVTGQITGGFLIGFPYKYGSHVLKCIAYDVNNVFPVSLDVSLEDRSGFYGVKINFPQGSPQLFHVIFILSNDLLSQSGTSFNLDFPAYPALVKAVSNCNVTLVLPEGAQNVAITKDDETVSTSSFEKENLEAFTYSPATATFSLSGNELKIIDVKTLYREIQIDAMGEIAGSDSYQIVNNSPNDIDFLEIVLPANASNIAGTDQFGRALTVEPISNSQNIDLYNVTFLLPIKHDESTRLTVKYDLPSITSEQANQFTLNASLFPYLDYYVEQASVTVVPPEGARILNSENSFLGGVYSLARNVFQESLTVNRQGVTYIDSLISSENSLQVVYEYNTLWLSFRPTLWVWALAIVGCTIGVVWRRPRGPTPARVAAPSLQVGVRPDYVKSFTDAYEEKKKVVSELDSLENRARRGKIPRRRYKVQKKTLETRLNTLSRNVAETKEALRGAGGAYADLMRQLEVAETEINGVETNIKSIRTRHSRGELSFEAYRKLLADYERRKEKAETAVNGILLRLREEIR